MTCECSESARERRIALYENDQQQQQLTFKQRSWSLIQRTKLQQSNLPPTKACGRLQPNTHKLLWVWTYFYMKTLVAYTQNKATTIKPFPLPTAGGGGRRSTQCRGPGQRGGQAAGLTADSRALPGHGRSHSRHCGQQRTSVGGHQHGTRLCLLLPTDSQSPVVWSGRAEQKYYNVSGYTLVWDTSVPVHTFLW